jgi:hypothetical protein
MRGDQLLVVLESALVVLLLPAPPPPVSLGGVHPSEPAKGNRHTAVMAKVQMTFRRFINVSPESDEGEIL